MTSAPTAQFEQHEATAREILHKANPEITFERSEYNGPEAPDVELTARHPNGLALIIIFYADPATFYPYRVITAETCPLTGYTHAHVDDGWGFGSAEDMHEHLGEQAEEMARNEWAGSVLTG